VIAITSSTSGYFRQQFVADALDRELDRARDTLHAGADRQDIAGADRAVGIAIALETYSLPTARAADAVPRAFGRLSSDGACGISTSDSLTQHPLAIGFAAYSDHLAVASGSRPSAAISCSAEPYGLAGSARSAAGRRQIPAPRIKSALVGDDGNIVLVPHPDVERLAHFGFFLGFLLGFFSWVCFLRRHRHSSFDLRAPSPLHPHRRFIAATNRKAASRPPLRESSGRRADFEPNGSAQERGPMTGSGVIRQLGGCNGGIRYRYSTLRAEPPPHPTQNRGSARLQALPPYPHRRDLERQSGRIGRSRPRRPLKVATPWAGSKPTGGKCPT